MNKDKILQEATNFFKTEPGFKRLFQQFIKNYQRLGRLGGNVKLTRLTNEEKEALSGLFRKDFSKQSSATVSVSAFQKALEQTRFADIELIKLLFAFNGGEILTNTEEKEKYAKNKKEFFAKFKKIYNDFYCQKWINHIEEKGKGTRGIHLAYEQDSKLLEFQLHNVLKALCNLPGKSEYYRLPVFSEKITRDPHAFDLNSQQGRFLISALAFIRKQHEDYDINNSPKVEEITELLSYFGIVRDDILNFVTFTGILADSSPWLKKSWEEGIVLNLPLKEIVKVKKFYPADKKIVFAVENSGVFSEILDRYQFKNLPPLICTNGQFKLATLILFDRLVSGGIEIYYSGDFDPEGLQMAQRLATRYPRYVKLWHYTEKDYIDCQSEVDISSQRLKKLKSVNLPQLSNIKQLMLKNKKAGYQEKLINKLVKDIEAIFNEK